MCSTLLLITLFYWMYLCIKQHYNVVACYVELMVTTLHTHGYFTL